MSKQIKDAFDFKTAYDAGYDCGLHGANNFNCHFKWFRTKESMQEWERGKNSAIDKNQKP